MNFSYSILIPFFNGKKHFKKQIETILKQIDNKTEILISDDGSNNQNLYYLSELEKKYENIFILTGPSKGVVKNVEFLLNQSRGKFIFLCDQDDVWLNGKFKKGIFFLKTNDLVFHQADVDYGKKFPQCLFFDSKNKVNLKPFPNLIKNRFLGCTMCFRATLLSDILPFPSYTSSHDWWIGLVSTFMKKKIHFIDESLIKYRRHGDNLSTASEKSNRNIFIKTLDRLYMLFHITLLKIRNKR